MKAAYTRLLVWPRSVRKSEYLTASESCGLNSAVEINYEGDYLALNESNLLNVVILSSFIHKNCRIGC
jgi:hypothetical protein